MIIKVLLIGGIAGAALLALRTSGSAFNLAVRRLATLAFVAVAAAAVAFPDAVTWCAERVGVGRGSDLVLYGLVVAFLLVTVGLHQRLHRQQGQIVRLTRELALVSEQARERPEDPPRPGLRLRPGVTE